MREILGGLRHAVALAGAGADDRFLLMALADAGPSSGRASGPTYDEPELDAEGLRLRALVDLATQGDTEAFGQLYDHYVSGIYRFVYYRVGSTQLAEDLTSETFVRGLRAVQRFSWQGKDFGAWLTTIARNLIADHYKSSRSRLEIVSDSVPESKQTVASPEDEVLSLVSNEMLFEAVNLLPAEQRDCVLMRFIQGLSIAQTAAALGRSEGAVKQLQLRAVRSLAKNISGDVR
ncbi:putative RNA polymerase sigma-70 factor, TIGR02952 family [Aeromicrobium marinum DSM 15272]|uniref:RNA polymerase sigma-70 factor, TIGR02952 family n=1 Tax=Aeromicrobium marinum DSM 15272 TaxID=585531 RepID=E2SC16_9ACTN|nr:sigma-70 family RNA polymerase sigma factor [Aeromicrobium marinum]EFQ83302.1 putative RNA polymerase sigma-70 factor, TIGR02952 family [Aeromicrobium marinum DSM 15272]